jgi:hypothetical protein
MANPSNYAAKTVSVATSATALAAQNLNRDGLILFNQGSATARIYFDTATDAYIELESNKTLHFPAAPSNAVNAVTASGTALITVMEG